MAGLEHFANGRGRATSSLRILLTALLIGSAAMANNPPATPDDSKSELGKRDFWKLRAEASGRAIARSIAICVMKRQPAEARTYIDTHGEALAVAYKPLTNSLIECLGQQAHDIKINNHVQQSLYAEAWLRQNGIPSLPGSSAAPGYDIETWASKEPAQRKLDQVAACLAQVRPDLVGAVILSEPGSKAEIAAFAALAPQMKSCGADDVGDGANQPDLRLALALATYHRLYDGAPIASESGTTR